MARQIEFLGVPGVGKTATYNFLKGRVNRNTEWTVYEELCKTKNLNKRGIKGKLKWQLKKLLKIPTGPDVPHDRLVLNRFIESNRELMELFWQKMAGNENSVPEDIRFYETRYIRNISEKVQNIKEHPSDKFCIVDEGLIHNLNYFIPNNLEEEKTELVPCLFEIMDLPHALVFFTGDVETVVNRTLSRTYTRLRDRCLTRKELEISREVLTNEKNFFVKEARKKGIPVLELDAKDSVRLKSARITNFLSELNENQD